MISDMNSKIAELASEQRTATEEINTNVTAINNVAQGIVADSEVVTKSSHEVEGLVKEMDHLVSKFSV